MRKRQRGCLGYLVIPAALMILIPAVPALREIGEEADARPVSGGESFYQEAEENSVEDKYYYGLLSKEEQIIYREIAQGLQDGAREIRTHGSDPDLANEIFSLVLRDCPDMFWCDGAAQSTCYEGGFASESYTVVEPVYNCQPEERAVRQEEIEREADRILQGISGDASDYEKILYVYEYIVDHTEYEEGARDSQNIYSVFAGGRSVCAGYAKAFQYLMDRLGVPAIYVTGTARGSSHAWNLVRCGGRYYHVDATWGDPVYQTEEGESSPEWENITYDYMCCSDAEIYRTHAADEKYSLPECTDMEWNYYVVNGIYRTGYDREETLEILNQNIYRAGNPTVFKYPDESTYQTARDEILGELVHIAARNLCSYYGKEQVEYYYQEQPELCKLTIYWDYQ